MSNNNKETIDQIAYCPETNELYMSEIFEQYGQKMQLPNKEIGMMSLCGIKKVIIIG